jgi:hypothetical protein
MLFNNNMTGVLQAALFAGFHQSLNKTSASWVVHDQIGNFMAVGTAWTYGNCAIVEGKHMLYLKL